MTVRRRAAATGAAHDRPDARRRFPHHAEPEPRSSPTCRPSEQTAIEHIVARSTVCSRPGRACGATRWPASRCRPAGSRWPRANAICPICSTALESASPRMGSRADDIVIRMTGCPNGCARPYLAEIGLVGKGPGRYNLYLGAAFDGSRMNKLYAEDLDHAGIVAALDPLFAAYVKERQKGEHFGDFTIRAGYVAASGNGRDFHANVRLPPARMPARCSTVTRLALLPKNSTIAGAMRSTFAQPIHAARNKRVKSTTSQLARSLLLCSMVCNGYPHLPGMWQPPEKELRNGLREAGRCRRRHGRHRAPQARAVARRSAHPRRARRRAFSPQRPASLSPARCRPASRWSAR